MKPSLARIRKDAQSIGSGITEVCAVAGVSRMTVHRWERGAEVDSDTMDRLVDALHQIASERMKAAEKVLG